MRKFLICICALLAALCALTGLACGTEPKHEGELVGISVKTEPIKLVYFPGEKLDIGGGILSAEYADGTREEIEFGKEMCMADLSEPGKKTVSVRYEEGGVSAETSFPVYVATKKVARSASLQRAVEEAADGDVLYLSGGTYYEQVVIDGKKLTLIGDGVVHIAGPQEYSEMKASPRIGAESRDFSALITIRNGADATLINLVVYGDEKRAAGEKALCQECRYCGIAVLDSSAELIEVRSKNTRFSSAGEPVPENGYGLYAVAVSGEHTLSMKKCEFGKFQHSAVFLRAAHLSAVIEDCKFLGGDPALPQIGIRAACPAKIAGCTFRNFENDAPESAAILLVGDRVSEADLRDNTFSEVRNEVGKA